MSDTAASIRHYASEDLVGRIMAALAAAGHDVSKPTVEMLYLIDQLHGGGLNSTKAQAALIRIGKDKGILDAGCGIGGSSRYLAHTYGCRVEAIDLTPQFVEAAARLNALCGMSDRIFVREGSVTDLPYPDRSFDVVWCQNVTMNVEDVRRGVSGAHPGRYLHVHPRGTGPGRRAALSVAVGARPFLQLSWKTRAGARVACRSRVRRHRKPQRGQRRRR